MTEAGTTSPSYSEPVSAINTFPWVSIQGKLLPSQDRAAVSCHSLPPSLSTSGATLCPLQGLCLQSNAWIFSLQKLCHGKYPAHPSPLGLLKSALRAWRGGPHI